MTATNQIRHIVTLWLLRLAVTVVPKDQSGALLIYFLNQHAQAEMAAMTRHPLHTAAEGGMGQ